MRTNPNVIDASCPSCHQSASLHEHETAGGRQKECQDRGSESENTAGKGNHLRPILFQIAMKRMCICAH